jgi:hypothetical protein
VEDIGRLYHLNKQRLEQWDPSLPLAKQSAAFQVCHQALETALSLAEKMTMDPAVSGVQSKPLCYLAFSKPCAFAT